MTIIASIHGRAARDGELRESRGGKPWCRVSVACEAGTDRETGEKYTQWLTVVAFGKQAEELSRIARGQLLSAYGRVELNKWQGQDGAEHEQLQLIVDSLLTTRSARPGGGRRAAAQGGRSADRSDHQAPADLPFDDKMAF